MADLLIKHLENKSKEHTSLTTLWNQWGFDKNLIPKALQSIGNLFPHFSRHDESHSKQILVNIERILGNNIELLTATDTWLLLEAAYWHDIGMVVPRHDLESAFNSDEFEEFLESLKGNNNELAIFAKRLIGNGLNPFSADEPPLETTRKLENLMAEWFRRKHATRAKEIIQAPWEKAGISSPRTELIPARIIKLLGRICEMHGAPFAHVIGEQGLPFRETGLAQEDCHPRFVACLLRIGDLLDLDDNRFCPVMQRIAGDGRPELSKAHEDKHAAIRHLRIDKERIEITAECETLDGYLEAFKWFDWLKKEIQDQMSNWQEIAPRRELGLLPAVGPIKLSLKGELQIINEGQRPQFSVDVNKAISLIQGSNIYSSKAAYIRELIQNAIDATLIQLWKDRKDIQEDNFKSPDSATELLSRRKIEISISEEGDSQNLENHSIWKLRIQDRGTGISRNDISHMMRIGSSQTNTKRQKLIKGMPEWLKPSGSFGIGLQSAFLICDRINFKTKSTFTHEALDIAMHSPTGKNDGLILIKTANPDDTEYGTITEIELELEKNPSSWSYDPSSHNSITAIYMADMDPVLDKKIPVRATNIADEIIKTSKFSPIKIHTTLTTAEKKTTKIESIVTPSEKKDAHFITTKEHCVEVGYTVGSFPRNMSKFLYRGQEFECKNIYIPYVSIFIDILSGSASSWLSASRDKIASDATESMYELILDSLHKAIEIDISQRNVADKGNLSLFLEIMRTRDTARDWQSLANEVHGEWINLSFNDLPLKEILSRKEWIATSADSEEKEYEGLIDLIIPSHISYLIGDIIAKEWLKKPGHCIQAAAEEDLAIEIPEPKTEPFLLRHLKKLRETKIFYRFYSKQKDIFTEKALATAIMLRIRNATTNRRFTLELPDAKWKKLHLKSNNPISAVPLFPYFIGSHDSTVLLPFLFKGGLGNPEHSIEPDKKRLPELINAIEPYLATSSSAAEIEATYLELIEYINRIMSTSKYAAEWASSSATT